MTDVFKKADDRNFRNAGILLGVAAALLIIGVCFLVVAFSYTLGGVQNQVLHYLVAGLVSVALGAVATLAAERRTKRLPRSR